MPLPFASKWPVLSCSNSPMVLRSGTGGGWPSSLTSACFWVLAPALKYLPLGIVYAIWSGVGIVAAVLIGLLVFSERLAMLQFLFIVMILVGAVGLRLTTAPQA